MVRKRMSDAGKPKKPKAGQSFAEKCPEKAAQMGSRWIQRIA